MASPTLHNLVDVVNYTFEKAPVLRYFYNMLYRDYMPNINGFVLAYLLPPHLSGYGLSPDPNNFLGEVGKQSIFLAIDINPPTTQVQTTDISGSFGGIGYGTNVSESNQMSVTYIDNSNLEIYSAHKIWIDYIRDVTIGEVEPDSEYIGGGSDLFSPGECYIDYLAALYIIKFRPTAMTTDFKENIISVGKAVGIFPISLPDKELIGRRDANELVILSFTYFCSIYRQYVVTNGMVDKSQQWVFDEIVNLLTQYG